MRKVTVNKPLAVVVAAIAASAIMAVFVYGLSADGAALFVLLKATVLIVGLLWSSLTVKRARRRNSDDEREAEVGE
jgi:Flp pilus assembly protein TadB